MFSCFARCKLTEVKQLLRRTSEYPYILSFKCCKPAINAPLEISNTAAANGKETDLLFYPKSIPKKNTKNMSVLLKARNMGILITANAFIPQNTPLIYANE